MALSKKTRFDVFKRDAFTCSYCGRKPPDVTLEVDHIIPRAEAGGDEIDNLTTSCFDCNRGKRDGLLSHRPPLRDLSEQTQQMREREEQLRAYHEAKAEEIARRDEDFDEVWTYWFDLWNATSLPKYATPWENALRSAVNRLGVAEVKEAMDIAYGRFSYPNSAPAKYLGGILRRKMAASEGRIAVCEICAEPMVLSREQLAKDGADGWVHTGCAEKRG